MLDIKAPNATEDFPLRASIIAATSSGISEAKGATHCINKNSLIPSILPVSINPCTKGLTDKNIIKPANAKRNITIGILTLFSF